MESPSAAERTRHSNQGARTDMRNGRDVFSMYSEASSDEARRLSVLCESDLGLSLYDESILGDR